MTGYCLYQCVVCAELILTRDKVFRHCNKLTQWINGIEGKGLDMKSEIVEIQVRGSVKMSRENLERILITYQDEYMGLLYSLHMGYVDSTGLEFDLPDGM